MAKLITLPQNAIVRDIELHLTGNKQVETVCVQQYDSESVYIRATIYDNGNLYTITESDNVEYISTKPNGDGICNSCGRDNEGKIIYEVTANTTAQDGWFDAQFKIHKSTGGTKSTPKFKMSVDRAALLNETVLGVPEFNVLDELITDANEAINTVANIKSNEQYRINNENTRIDNEEDRQVRDAKRPDWVKLTQAQYDALSMEQKMSNTFYEIMDDDGEVITDLEVLVDDLIQAKTAYDESVTAGSNTEVVKARKSNVTNATYNVVGDRLDTFDRQLAHITNNTYVSDTTVGNNIAPLKLFSLDYLQAKQNALYATFMRNLRKGVVQKICCQGDSLTYGHDVVSADKRPASTDIAPDGSVSSTTRASTTYPEALETNLKKLYPNISVINRGRSGSYTKHGYELWSASANANLTIMMYGTNDSRASWVDYKGNIEEYLKWYEKLIAREILRGSAVIILTPPKETEQDLDIDTFSQSLFLLGDKYGVPVIKTDEFMYNYGTEIYSDEVHFNGLGYGIFGARVASLFIGEGCKTPQFVGDGSKINALPTIYNYSKNGDVYVAKSIANWPTAQGFHMGVNNGVISFSFYSDADDLLVFPSIYARGTVSFKVELDFGITQGMYTNSQIIDKGDKNVTEIAPSKIEKSITGTYPYFNRYKTPAEFIHIVNKGWHTITITNLGGNADNNILFYGLEFINFNTLKALTPKPLDIKTISTLRNGFTITNGQYCKNMQGEVKLQGRLANVSKNLALTLDSGYCPTVAGFFCVPAKKNDNSYTSAVISVYPSGGVYVESDTTNIANIWLDGINFKTT